MSADLFAQSVERAVAEVGEDQLTRSALLKAVASFHDYDSGGLAGPVDIGGRLPSDCFAMFQVQDGEFVRVYPKEQGELDCDPENVVTVKFDNT